MSRRHDVNYTRMIFIRDEDRTVKIRIRLDSQKIAEVLGRKAARNKSKRATLMSGYIVAEVHASYLGAPKVKP